MTVMAISTARNNAELIEQCAALGSRLVDQLHLPSYRAQPPGRRQVHARRNYSTLLVLRKTAS